MTEYAQAVLEPSAIGPERVAPAPPTSPEPSTTPFAFSPRLRRAAIAYVALIAPVAAVAFWGARGPDSYLRSMVIVSALVAVPGLALAIVSAMRAPAADRLVRWLWTGVFVLGGIGTALGFHRIRPGMDPPVLRTTVPVIAALVLLVVANTLMMRARSGQRAALVDAVDIVMATIALTAPFGLAFGAAILGSPLAWFSAASALWVVIACHGTMVAVVIRSRVEPGRRQLAEVGIAFGVATMVSSAAGVVLGTSEFVLPAGPFIGLYAVSVGLGMVFFAFATTESSPGLERLPASGQVRRNSIIAIVVLVSVPVIATIVWWRHDESWIPEAGLAAVLVLLVLSSIRHLLAARESMRLHDLVEQSAHERGELLAEVMDHVDTDRHRAAAHLHRQAASMYAAMAAFTSAIDQAVEAGNPASVSFAAERLRRDLGQRADGLRRLAQAVKPISPNAEEARRLAAPMRAYLENLAIDGPRPELIIDVDPDLALDWATEAAVLRIVQEATLNAWWPGCASTVQISITANGGAVCVEIVDDGQGGPPPPSLVQNTMQSVTRFLGGDLTTSQLPDGGTRVSARIPVGMTVPNDPDPPHLRLIDSR